MSSEELPRGKRRGRGRVASRARSVTLPRLARWAGVGVFVLTGLTACNDATGPEMVESGYIYVAGYIETLPGIQKFLAKTGDRKTSFTPKELCISADVDPGTGDVFVYTWNCLRRYTADGQLKFEVRARTLRYSGREYIDLNEKTGIIYFLNGEGRLYRFRASDGEDLGILHGTDLVDAEQLLVDDDENRIWVVGKDGAEVRKYSPEREQLLILKDGPYTRIRLEPQSNTVILGVIKNRLNYLYRYTKGGVKVKEIPTGVEPKNLAVEPGTGVIWVSDGAAIERYAPSGEWLDDIPAAGFEFIDFGADGAAAFIVDKEGYFSAYNADNLTEVWREQHFGPRNDIHLVKYNDK